MKGLSKIYTLVLVTLPALNTYTGFIPSIELGTLLVMICTVIFAFSGMSKARFSYDIVWLLLMALFLIGTLVASLYNTNYSFSFFFRLLKIIVLVLSVFWIGKPHINYNYAVNVLTFFSVASAVFIIIQSVAFYGAGFQIPGIFSPLAYNEGHDYGNLLNGKDLIFRPSSFFMEPAHFAAYEFVFLCFLLANHEIKKRILLLIITIGGLFFSTSGTAYAMIPILFIFSYLFARDGKKEGRVIKGLFFVTIAVAVFVVIVLSTDIGAITIGRLIDGGETTVAVSGRLESEGKFLFENLPNDWKYFGCGYGFRPQGVYMPSLYQILLGDGYVGVIAIYLLILYYFQKTSSFGRMLCISYAILFVGTGCFNFASIGLYFCFISAETAIRQKQKRQLLNTQKEWILAR